MEKVIRTYRLNDDAQKEDTLAYWENQSIKNKLEVVETLRVDAIKMGLYPNLDETEPRLRRVYKVTTQK